MAEKETTTTSNFIRTIIDEDMASNKFGGRVHTRFPPEPNGYLHIGHVKSIYLNYGLAQAYGGKFNLRFDDTNPLKEEQEYIDAIIRDMQWLGVDWEDRLLYASDYFDQMFQWTIELIKQGKAYVDDQTADEIRENRGTLTAPGTESPYRNRSVDENLHLFTRMAEGEFPDGSRVLRAKIDMASPIINLRDPVMYRILHAEHPRTGNDWNIYPMYDWAHGQSDSIEGITHSICTLEFINHRPLYDWFLDELDVYHPQQIEFAKLYLTHTIMSKRNLIRLVKGGHVDGWDDPRMPTVAAIRRRGYRPEALQAFMEGIGVGKSRGKVGLDILEEAVRNDLNHFAPRAMAVLHPLRVVIENYPEGQEEIMSIKTFPQNRESTVTHEVPFSRVVYIEQDDFMETPPNRKYKRMSPGVNIRLMGAYVVKCTDIIKDEAGNVVELRCEYDPETRGGVARAGHKPKGTIHWVSAAHAVDAEVRLYESLFAMENPEIVPEGGDFIDNINPDSLQILTDCKLEPRLANTTVEDHFQFMRTGYFCLDAVDSKPEALVFNRTVSLRDTWARKK